MAQDPFEAFRKAPYTVFTAPRPYSFDLNEDMVSILRKEFSADIIATKFCEAIGGKAPSEIEKIGKKLFEDYGQKWMKRTMQLSDEYPDRTIEMVMETIDRSGKQFLIWPHVPQRYVEIAYLSAQQFLKLPVTLNNARELAYRVPQCLLYNTVIQKCGAEVANMMTCKNACLKALETIAKDMEMELLITMPAVTAKDSFCEFSMKKL
jgi:hypothetical protein